MWYPYYAGFSASFAAHAIQARNLKEDALVADPWNGAGTTTAVAFHEGLGYWGGDINPAMVIVARAKTATQDDIECAVELINQTLKEAMGYRFRIKSPLHSVLPDAAADLISRMEFLLRLRGGDEGDFPEIPEEMSSSLALAYLVMFRAAKSFVGARKTSNPTWLKAKVVDSSNFNEAAVIEAFSSKALEFLGQEAPQLGMGRGSFNQSSATEIPLSSRSVDLIVTSPPYCTRIDYAVATGVEQALLRLDAVKQDQLRRRMTGTTTVERTVDAPRSEWGRTCLSFLDKVQNHPAKASATYYYKSHVQYFRDLYSSIAECARITKIGGEIVFVVQDSNYKDVRNDLANISIEMFQSVGAGLVSREDYAKVVNMRSLNSASRKYGNGAAPVESVINLKM